MTGVIILILLGIILFLIEFLIIPGTTVAGIGGLILMAGGVYLAFDNFGNQTGLIVLIGSFVVSIIILIIALRANTWKRVMLNTNADSKVYEDADANAIKAGDRGITMTRLAPIGKVKVNNISIEAKSISGYIDPHKEITVVKLSGSQLIVKLINE
jgi:membrane-bound ClpP family serine protease